MKAMTERLSEMLQGTIRVIEELKDMEYSFKRMKNMESI